MSEPFLGEIRMFAGNFAPRGWAFCNGQLLSIAQNSALFAILGTTYGGNGQSTFALPNLQSRVPLHPGQGPGLSPYSLGQTGGSETVTLLTNQMPAHTHLVSASSSNGNTVSPQSAFPASNANNNRDYNTSANTTMSSQMISAAGGSQPHNNVQPYTCVNFIIALEGIFPSRN